MVIVCEGCGQKGTVDEQFYSGKKLKLRCPHCSYDFIFSVPSNGSLSEAGVIEASVAAAEPVVQHASEERPPAETSDATVLEAKRIARLIISEIKLYNQDKIARAANRREILELLKEDLMRGRQHYNSRIASKLPLGPDYFMESVKDILLVGKS
jgi:hypothetical protein